MNQDNVIMMTRNRPQSLCRDYTSHESQRCRNFANVSIAPRSEVLISPGLTKQLGISLERQKQYDGMTWQTWSLTTYAEAKTFEEKSLHRLVPVTYHETPYRSRETQQYGESSGKESKITKGPSETPSSEFLPKRRACNIASVYNDFADLDYF